MYVGRISAQATVDALVTELSSLNPDSKSSEESMEVKDDEKDGSPVLYPHHVHNGAHFILNLNQLGTLNLML